MTQSQCLFWFMKESRHAYNILDPQRPRKRKGCRRKERSAEEIDDK